MRMDEFLTTMYLSCVHSRKIWSTFFLISQKIQRNFFCPSNFSIGRAFSCSKSMQKFHQCWHLILQIPSGFYWLFSDFDRNQICLTHCETEGKNKDIEIGNRIARCPLLYLFPIFLFSSSLLISAGTLCELRGDMDPARCNCPFEGFLEALSSSEKLSFELPFQPLLHDCAPESGDAKVGAEPLPSAERGRLPLIDADKISDDE